MLRNRKTRILLSFVLMAVPALAVLLMNPFLEGSISYTSILTISGIFLGLQLLMELVENRNFSTQSPKVVRLIYFMIPVLNLFVCGMGVAVMSGIGLSLFRFVGLFMGAMFILIGNYIPKCTRNRTMGIKVKWTLESDENWRATHRFGGIVWCIAGVIMCSCIFLPERLYLGVFLVIVLLSAVIPTVYSYLFYRRCLREGTFALSEEVNTSISPRAKKLTAVLVSLTLVIVPVLLFTGDVKITLGETSLTAQATFWSRSEISYDEIAGIDYLSNASSDTRVFGVGSPRLLVGRFKNDELGQYTRYTYTKCKSAVLIVTMDGDTYMIGCKTESETAELYNELEARILKDLKETK